MGHHTQRLLDQILAATTEQSMIATDEHGTVTVFNVGAERMLGYRADEVVGACTPYRFHLPEEVRTRATEIGVEAGFATLLAIARKGATDAGQWTYVRKDGGTVAVRLTVSLIRDAAGDEAGLLSIARDITAELAAKNRIRLAYERERACTERMRELDTAKSDFVQAISHDLAAPLTSVLYYQEQLIEHELATEETRRLAGAAHHNACRLRALIHDLSTIAAVSSGGRGLNRRAQPLEPIVRGALEALAGTLARRSLSVEIAPLDRITVNADAVQLERVFTNLLSNAVKFTPDGGRVAAAAKDTGDGVQIDICDTGPGIPADELPQIFDRHFRSARTRHTAAGTGLGLTITRAIVEAHGGSITVASRQGEGTTFTVTIPHRVIDPTAPSIFITTADIRRALQRAHLPDPDRLWPDLLARAGLRGDETDRAAIERLIEVLSDDPATHIVGVAMRIRANSPNYTALGESGERRDPRTGLPAHDPIIEFLAPLGAPPRMDALARYDLSNPELRQRLDEICQRTATRLSMPTSMVSIVLEGAQFFAGAYGVTGWMAQTEGTPAEWAFCAHAVLSANPIYVVSDASAHPSHRDSPLVVLEGTRAYAGARIVEPGGQVLGMHCVVSPTPASFTEADLGELNTAAGQVANLLEAYRHDGRARPGQPPRNRT